MLIIFNKTPIERQDSLKKQTKQFRLNSFLYAIPLFYIKISLLHGNLCEF